MKKRKIFLMATLTALAMASCSSFEEPAALTSDGEDLALTRSGIRAIGVSSEADLREAIEFEEEEIQIVGDFTLTEELTINYPVTISAAAGKTLTTQASIICTSDVTFNNVTIDATTPKGKGAITMGAEDITVILNGVKLTQNTTGTSDSNANVGIGISNIACNNTLEMNNTIMNLPGKYMRAIHMYTPTASSVTNRITGCHITCGKADELSYPSTYSRGLSFSNVDTDNTIIDNTTIEGAYYIINVNGTSKVNVTVQNNSVLDGRAAFNVWTPNFIGTVKNSTLIGRNNYSGPTEVFANIVMNPGSENGTLNLNDVTFKMEVQNFYAANEQYAISFRQSNQKLILGGTITCISNQGEINDYVNAREGITNIEVTRLSNLKFNFANSVCKMFMGYTE